ncbi:MAG TPA: pitrilysin family protein [Phycisphaerales bacterium]|nr:pitrilysin family protein [Phycisphaerales bacterium]HMP37542.1 pitrilysin family protein [Phycisphaerales bacterium]
MHRNASFRGEPAPLLRSTASLVSRLALALVGALASAAAAQQVEVEEFTLDNGMKFLLVPRSDQPNVIAAGWLAKVGSVNERPGITGISHFFEHMMFKGTNTIGTRAPEEDEAFRMRQKEIRDRINALVWGEQYARYFRGEIDDPWNAANDTPELSRLRAELKQLMDDHREVIVKDEFDAVYARMGGSGMNAFTSHDLTFYFVNVPSNKFELWAWMESDRLDDSVFREFYAERDVVHEERRLRTESTPTGMFQEQFDSLFWVSSPYSWPVIGWTSDLNSYTKEEAWRYWDVYYRPNNLVGVIVGDFDPIEAKATIERYFSRLRRGESDPPPVVTLEVKQIAEQRMNAECDCQPQVEVRYHTVPFNHADSFALEVLAEILNGRTGRLYKGLVEGREIASSARAGQEGRKYAGAFSFDAEVRGDATPAMLEEAWYEILAELQENLVPAEELQKVKNRVAADNFRRLQSNFFLLVQLGYFEGLGDWRYINEAPRRLQAVTAEDLRRVAQKYFAPTNRSVATYLRKAGAAPVDEELAALDARAQGMVRQMLAQIAAIEDEAMLAEMVMRLEAESSRVPPDFKPAFDIVLRRAKARLAELGG